MLFPKEGLQFLASLEDNNNGDWFTHNKSAYELHVKAPAKAISAALTEALSEMLNSPVDAKTFRINRDVRFSKDKTPYNCHIRLAFWDTASCTKKAMGGPAFYLSIESSQLVIGAGCMAMPPTMLDTYRRKINICGSEVSALMENLEKQGARFDAPALKSVPMGYDKSHANALLLRRKGITCWFDHALSGSEDILAETCLASFKAAMPIHDFVRSLEKADLKSSP